MAVLSRCVSSLPGSDPHPLRQLSALLESDPDPLAPVQNNFILRRTMPGQVRFYTGNGVLGWYNPAISGFTYQILSSSNFLLGQLNSTSSLILLIPGTLLAKTRVAPPTSARPSNNSARWRSTTPIAEGQIVQVRIAQVRIVQGSAADTASSAMRMDTRILPLRWGVQLPACNCRRARKNRSAQSHRPWREPLYNRSHDFFHSS